MLRFKSNKVNKFKDVKLPSGRDLFERYGERLPRPVQSSGVAYTNNSRIAQLRDGEKAASAQLAVLEREAFEAQQAQEPAPEPAPEPDASGDAE